MMTTSKGVSYPSVWGCNAVSFGEWFPMLKKTIMLLCWSERTGPTVLSNCRNRSPSDTGSYPRRLVSASEPLWEIQISHSVFVANLLRVRTPLDGHLNGGVWKWLKTPRLHLKIMIGSYSMKTAVKGGERKGNKFIVHKNFKLPCLWKGRSREDRDAKIVQNHNLWSIV